MRRYWYYFVLSGFLVAVISIYAVFHAKASKPLYSISKIQVSWGFDTRIVEIQLPAGTIKARTLNHSTVRMRMNANEITIVEHQARMALQDLDPYFIESYNKTHQYPSDGDWWIEVQDQNGNKYYMRWMEESFLRKRHFRDIATYIRMCDLSDTVVQICIDKLPENERLDYHPIGHWEKSKG